ncbi:MAG: sulfate adenylyltransferase subunit 2 [Candidatus Methanomarinus sp.]|jgi:sulfate adenylyltransferase subunit 2|uniref:Sulfate adenylyltransferase subunit 2 n=1 Tax=Candidatus Methanomarinus sp. TaxID=3386244 RepID=A0AC61SBW5_9EURY|nr:MAG: sulfate adenylyltransferase subunit 2 [ANME-2 cluster archaeon]PPA79735.1 MAG: sulfate adenylyltransferase subunit 2 [ANME-2 cluster archaeon HR1]TKY92146.1 MAG: sulfate adenylyltransferase subunit 2 [ANME-2 cluster archaeon]
MKHLDQLESQSIYIIREAYKQFKNIAILWSIGKDSTTLMWLTRKAFYGKVPFPALHIDTSYKFQEIYDFRSEWADKWDMELIIGKNGQSLNEGMGPDASDKLACCGQLKTEALKQTIDKYGFKALLLGIRRDEHGIRAKERVFSPRDKQFKWDYKDQPPELWDQFKNQQQGEQHIRVHPLLHWTEQDIWKYIQRENIPVVDLYFANNGKRYRSIGCETCCEPVDSDADTVDKIVEELMTTKISERSGRAQDKESAYVMQKLRALGYM